MVHRTWKLVSNKDSSHVELYSLAEDPYEKTDLGKDHPEVVKQLLETLEEWKGTLPDRPSGNVFSTERNG